MNSKSFATTAELKVQVGRNVWLWRRQRGWSQARLAVKAGLSTAMIGKLEQGLGNPRVTTLQAIATALGVDPTALLISSG